MGITDVFGVPDEKVNRRRVIDFWAERTLCVGNAHFKLKCLHKYTRVAIDQDGMEVMIMIDLMLEKRFMRYSLYRV